MTLSALASAKTARVVFLLKNPGTLTRHEQYAELASICTPIMQAHGIYERMGWISNPKDFRGAGFWLVSPTFIATRIRHAVEGRDDIECSIWITVSSSTKRENGEWAWDVTEVEVA